MIAAQFSLVVTVLGDRFSCCLYNDLCHYVFGSTFQRGFVMFTAEQGNLLILAVDLKVASIKRASKSSSSAFQALYDKELQAYTVLSSLIRSAVNETQVSRKG